VVPCRICLFPPWHCKCSRQLTSRCWATRRPGRRSGELRRASPTSMRAPRRRSPGRTSPRSPSSPPDDQRPTTVGDTGKVGDASARALAVGDRVAIRRHQVRGGRPKSWLEVGSVQAFWQSRKQRKAGSAERQVLVRFEGSPGGDWFPEQACRLVERPDPGSKVEVLPGGEWARNGHEWRNPHGELLTAAQGAHSMAISDLVMGVGPKVSKAETEDTRAANKVKELTKRRMFLAVMQEDTVGLQRLIAAGGDLTVRNGMGQSLVRVQPPAR
jgi:hypothetical protein